MDLAPIMAGATALTSVGAWRLVTKYDIQLAIMGRNVRRGGEFENPALEEYAAHVINDSPAPTATVRVCRVEDTVFEMDDDYNCDKSHLEIFKGDRRPCKHGCPTGLYIDTQGCGVCARCKSHRLDPRTCDHFHRLAAQDRHERGAP